MYELVDRGIGVVWSTAYLDEAERCRRVGLMHQGRLLAVDTPSGVKALLRTDLVEIGVRDAWRAREALTHRPEISEISVFGQRLHVALANSGRELPAILDVLEAADLAPREVRRIMPSLEDVFVAVLADSQMKKPLSVA